MSMPFLIAYLSFGSIILPLLLSTIQWKKLTGDLVILHWILISSFLIDSGSLVLMKLFNRGNTQPLVNAYLLIQFSLLFFIYARQFRNKLAFIIIYVCFLLFYFINLFYFQSIFVFNTNSNVFASLILIICALSYFYKLLNDLPLVHIHQLPMLWISFAALTYYSGTLFLFLANNYLTEVASTSHVVMWILHNLLNIIKNILFVIALWQSYRKMRSSILSSSVP
jgi:hypothetical protein